MLITIYSKIFTRIILRYIMNQNSIFTRKGILMDLIIRQAQLVNHSELVDIGIHNGKFIAISTNLGENGEIEINAAGKIVSPPFIESHVHLDDALSAGVPRFNKSGTLQEAIKIASERKSTLTKSEVK